VLAPRLLHPGLEDWWERDVRPRQQGRCGLRRFADAFCSGWERAADARQSMAVLPKRLARLGLTMHPEKTALLACGQPAARQPAATGNGPFAVLGLPHSWAQARRGWGVSKRRTARQRRRRTKQSRWRWGRATRHAPVPYQYPRLCLSWRGPLRSSGMRGHSRLCEEGRR
jgi:RNA-directed DNA polymerase